MMNWLDRDKKNEKGRRERCNQSIFPLPHGCFDEEYCFIALEDHLVLFGLGNLGFVGYFIGQSRWSPARRSLMRL